jgi:uncharacterized protein (TIGR03435 family)
VRIFALAFRFGKDRGGRSSMFTAFVFSSLLWQPLVAQNAPTVTGNWQGTVEAGRGFRAILQISQADRGKSAEGELQGVLYTMGVGGARESDLNSLTLQGTTLRFTIPPDGSFEGRLSADGKSIAGTLKYGAASYGLTLAHATADAAWAIPKPTDHMPADAVPQFEVATIKPTNPNWGSRGFHSGGRRIFCDNETADDLLSFAYGVHARQIVEDPGWLRTDKFDVDGVPDLIGEPSLKQMQAMYRDLLASRFNLALHHETREISVYRLQAAKSGPKLAKSLGDPNGTPDQTFTRWNSQLIELKETNATLAEFSQNMGMVLDRPMVDQTGLAGRFDFVLRWTPEGARTDDSNSPPGLFTAIQEQIGLRLDATRAPVDVLVIDHIDKPSPN